MKNYLAILAASTMMTLATVSFAADETAESKAKVEYKSDGGYEASRNAEHVTSEGTSNTTRENVDVEVDSKGLTSKTSKSYSVSDPKGLMNKKTDNTKTTLQEKERGGYKQTTTSKHTDADGTNVTLVTITDVDVDTNGNVTAVAKTDKTVDPKGMMNKKTTSSMTRTVNGKVVDEKKNTDY